MAIGLTLLAVLAAVIALFAVLNFQSRRSYRPSPADVTQILQSSIDGRLALGTFDEFSCVPIAYDARLDRVRQVFCNIVDDPSNALNQISRENATPLTEENRNKVRQLIREVQKISSEQRGAT
jgi:hypothetical protein